MSLRDRSKYLLDRLRRRPYRVESRGDVHYIIKRGNGDIGSSTALDAARAYAVKRNRSTR